jgi:hypothetical protein
MDFMGCLGDEYYSCISVDYLKSIGESDENAEKFVHLAVQLKLSVCHIPQLKINPKCEFDRLEKCATTFSTAVGLPSLPTDAEFLRAQIEKVLNGQPEGKTKVCK